MNLKKEIGNFIVLLLPVTLGFFCVFLFLIHFGQSIYYAEKTQTLADVSLLSSLRIRAKNLQAFSLSAGRLFSWLTEGNINEGLVPLGQRSKLDLEAQKLKRAFPSYKSNITGVLKAVMESNGIERAALQITDASFSSLELTPQPLIISEVGGDSGFVNNVWYRRDWSPNNRWGQPDRIQNLQVTLTYPSLGFLSNHLQVWELTRSASGRLTWDVDMQNTEIKTKGNGGFPRAWLETLDGNQVRPYPYAIFGAQLVKDENDDS